MTQKWLTSGANRLREKQRVRKRSSHHRNGDGAHSSRSSVHVGNSTRNHRASITGTVEGVIVTASHLQKSSFSENQPKDPLLGPPTFGLGESRRYTGSSPLPLVSSPRLKSHASVRHQNQIYPVPMNDRKSTSARIYSSSDHRHNVSHRSWTIPGTETIRTESSRASTIECHPLMSRRIDYLCNEEERQLQDQLRIHDHLQAKRQKESIAHHGAHTMSERDAISCFFDVDKMIENHDQYLQLHQDTGQQNNFNFQGVSLDCLGQSASCHTVDDCHFNFQLPQHCEYPADASQSISLDLLNKDKDRSRSSCQETVVSHTDEKLMQQSCQSMISNSFDLLHSAVNVSNADFDMARSNSWQHPNQPNCLRQSQHNYSIPSDSLTDAYDTLYSEQDCSSVGLQMTRIGRDNLEAFQLPNASSLGLPYGTSHEDIESCAVQQEVFQDGSLANDVQSCNSYRGDRSVQGNISNFNLYRPPSIDFISKIVSPMDASSANCRFRPFRGLQSMNSFEAENNEDAITNGGETYNTDECLGKQEAKPCTQNVPIHLRSRREEYDYKFSTNENIWPHGAANGKRNNIRTK